AACLPHRHPLIGCNRRCRLQKLRQVFDRSGLRPSSSPSKNLCKCKRYPQGQQCPLWVISGKARLEHLLSACYPIADITRVTTRAGSQTTSLPTMSDANSQTQSFLAYCSGSALHLLRNFDNRSFLFRMNFEFADVCVCPRNPFSFASHFISYL